VAFRARKSLEVTHLNLNDGTVEGHQAPGVPDFLLSRPPGGLSGHMTPKDTFNNSYKPLTLNK